MTLRRNIAVNRLFARKMLLTAGLLLNSAIASGETWRFGLIGDVPYSARERAELPKMLAHMADHQVQLIAHIGDIKHGGERCDDEVFNDRQALFAQSRVPLVYTPGDNDWTDCRRVSNGGYDPQERLATLRRLFWPTAHSLGQQKLALERQSSDWPEHSRWRLGPVLFVTLNLPGSNNNRGMTATPRSEFVERQPVVQAWLRDSFALARQQQLRGIVLLFQANPGFTHLAQGHAHNGYREFLETLRDETLNFPGEVVAVHGDTHISRIDQPLRDAHGRQISNFTRVETYGYPLMGWTRGIIDSAAPRLFRFETNTWPPAGH